MENMSAGLVCLVVIAFALVVMAFVAFNTDKITNKEQDELENARLNYEICLDRLKREPANADRYQKALDVGRIYSNLTRQKKGVTIYDEMALTNDLNAATAGAKKTVQPPMSMPIPTPAVTSAADRMRQLDDLRSQGLITDQEYADKRAKILQNL